MFNNEVQLRTKPHWELYATFLSKDCKMPVSLEYLAAPTAISYLRIMLNLAKEKLTSAESRVFYTCLNLSGGTDEAFWLKKLQDNMIRVSFERDRAAGKAQEDSGQTSLYIFHIIALMLAYSKDGSAEAAPQGRTRTRSSASGAP